MNTEKTETKEHYLKVWRKCLAELLGYNEEQADEWIKLNRVPWDEGFSSYIHEAPVFWVIDALITPEAKEKLRGAGRAKLKRDVLGAIEQGDFNWFSKEYDWRAARRRIEKVFSDYGVALEL